MTKRREEKPEQDGKRGLYPTGGRAGRRPGLGGRTGNHTTSGGPGRSHPMQGIAKSVFRQKPADRNPVIKNMFKPKPRPKS